MLIVHLNHTVLSIVLVVFIVFINKNTTLLSYWSNKIMDGHNVSHRSAVLPEVISDTELVLEIERRADTLQATFAHERFPVCQQHKTRTYTYYTRSYTVAAANEGIT